MKTSKGPAAARPTRMGYEALVETLLAASANGCVALISAKRDEDGALLLRVHVVDIKINDKQDIRLLIKDFTSVVANHSVFLRMAADA